MTSLWMLLRLAPCLLTWIVLANARADAAGDPPGWTIEQGTDRPSYGMVVPVSTDLNIDAIVLACEQAGDDRVLQLQLYLTDGGPLRSIHPHTALTKSQPRASITIDDRVFPVDLLFADDYVVLADMQKGFLPMLSDPLLDAMQRGRTMDLHFDLLAELPGQPPAFDGEVIVDLQAPGGRQVISTLRHCTGSDEHAQLSTAFAHP